MNEKCYRCKNKEITHTCLMCESFKLLCTSCDNYVHGLPSKKNHKRNLLKTSSSSISEKIENKKEREITQINDEINLKSINNSNNEQDYCYPYNTYISPTNEYMSTIKSENININPTHGNPLHLQSYTQLPLSSFSKEYLNEVKNIFEKEKSELLYKNTTLQNNLDRLKVSFTDQINMLNSDLEDLNKKRSMYIKNIQENSEFRIKSIISEKDCHIESLLIRISELEKINSELSNKVEEKLKIIYDLKTDYGEKNLQVEKDLIRKKEEFINIEDHYENKFRNCESKFQEDIKKLTNSYEMKIETLVTQTDEMEEKYRRIIEERDREIKSILQRQTDEQISCQNHIELLRQEINCHKQNIIANRSKRDNYEDEINSLRDLLEKSKQESKFQISEIKLLDNQYKSLMRENDDLKIQISKLNKLEFLKKRAPVLNK